MAQPSAPSVPLPRREQQSVIGQSQPPIWALSDAVQNVDPPLQAKCDRHTIERDGVCCKELKGEDERHLVDPDIVRDV